MASRSLGTLTLDLIAKIGGFTSGMDQASRIADKRMREIEKRANAFGRSIGQSIKSAGAQFLAFAGVTLTVGAALNSMKGAIDLADETRDLSIRLGESTETISEFRYAAQQTGTDMDALGKGMKILAKNAADALNPMSSQAKVFDALGIKVTDSAGNLKKLGELIPEIADKFKSLEDGTTKAALAQALFGKSGLDLTEFLNQGADGLQTMADKARELGIVIDQETADAADKFNDDLDDMKAAVGGIALQVARDLLPMMDSLALSFTDTAKQGQDVAEVADRISAGFKVAGYVAGTIGTVFSQLGEFLGAVAAAGKGAYEVIASIATVDFSRLQSASFLIQEASHGARDALLNRQGSSVANKPQQKINIITADSGGIPDSALRRSAGEVAESNKAAELERRLAKALSNPSSPKGKKGGKSDAEREAEQVARAIEQMTKAQQEWQNEIEQTGNPIADEYAGRLRDVAEQAAGFAKEGVPADKVKAFTDEMTKLATTLRDSDIAKFQQEFNDETASMAAQMQGPAAAALEQYRQDVAALDKELKNNLITLDEYNARLAVLGQVRDSPAKGVLQDIQQQTEALGMNNDQLEIANNLWRAGVSANSEWGQSIIKSTEELQKQRKATADQVDMMDGLRDSAHLFLDDLKEGKGIWDSLKDAAGNFADILFEIESRKLIENIFGQQGTASSGSGGGGWLSALLGLFSGSSSGGFGDFGGEGSPLAGGGWTDPNKFHQVGEHNRPEVLLRNGKQWLLPGDRGQVIPLHGMGGGGGTLNQTINYITRERVDNRSRKQVAQAAGMAAGEAMRSNGR